MTFLYTTSVGPKFGAIGDLTGTRLLTAKAKGPSDHPKELGHRVAQQLLDQGGGEILAEIRQEYENNESTH